MQKVIIDYFVCSWKISDIEEGLDLFQSFGLYTYYDFDSNFHLPGFQEIDSYYHLDKCFYQNGIKLHFSDEMVILDCSGAGCRALETFYDWNWEEFFNKIKHDLTYRDHPSLSPKAHISRLDVACDVIDDPSYTVKKIYDYVIHGKYVCKSKRFLHGSGTDEEWIYFGSPSSDRRLRIYNKAKEKKLEDRLWVRSEFQLRNDSALSFLLNYYNTLSLPETYYGVMHDYLRISKNYQTDPIMTESISLRSGKDFFVVSVN